MKRIRSIIEIDPAVGREGSEKLMLVSASTPPPKRVDICASVRALAPCIACWAAVLEVGKST